MYGGGHFLNEICDRLKKCDDQINQPSDSKEAKGEQVEDAHTDFPLVKFVNAEKAEEQAEKECNPLVFGAAIPADLIYVGICVVVGVIDDDLRLLLFQLCDLLPTLGADDTLFVDWLSAVLAEL